MSLPANLQGRQISMGASEREAKIHGTHAGRGRMESNKIFGAHLVSRTKDRFLARRRRRVSHFAPSRARRPAKNAVAAAAARASERASERARELDSFVPKTAGVVFAIKSQRTLLLLHIITTSGNNFSRCRQPTLWRSSFLLHLAS